MDVIEIDEDLVVPLFEAKRIPPGQMMYIVAGTQGEARSAMSKIARNEHHMIRIREGDTVIFSSRRIPGNEMRISAVIDNLARRGAIIHHMDNSADVHVSGHGHRNDLEEMLRIIRPRSFMPVHGNFHYLAQHAQLARASGVDDILVVENGEVVEYTREGLRRAGRCTAGKVHVDGSLSLSEKVLGERRQLADSGIVTAMVLVDAETGARLDEPQIHIRGAFDTARFPEIVASSREILSRTVDTIKRGSSQSPAEIIRREGRKALKRFYSRSINRHPSIMVIVVELASGGRPPECTGG
jgi:ribonuclease J